MIEHHDFRLYRGDAAAFSVELSDDGGEPLDLSGAVADMAVQPLYGGSLRPDLSVSGNKIDIYFPADLTRGALWQAAPYDLQVTLAGGVKTVLKGCVFLETDTTP